MIRVLVMAKSEVERAGLEAVARGGGMELVGSLREAQELAQALDEIYPDAVVFVESARAARDGDAEIVLAAWRETLLLSAMPHGPALVLLAEGLDPDQMTEAVRAGSFALLPSDASGQEIRASIEAAASGLVVLHPSFTDVVGAGPAPPPRPQLPGTTLTAREVEVLRLIASGLANKEIAARLEISEHTVKFHIASIFNKLDVSNRAEAVSSGMRWGLIMV